MSLELRSKMSWPVGSTAFGKSILLEESIQIQWLVCATATWQLYFLAHEKDMSGCLAQSLFLSVVCARMQKWRIRKMTKSGKKNPCLLLHLPSRQGSLAQKGLNRTVDVISLLNICQHPSNDYTKCYAEGWDLRLPARIGCAFADAVLTLFCSTFSAIPVWIHSHSRVFFSLVFANTALQNGFLSIHLPSLYIPSLRDPEKEEGDLKKTKHGNVEYQPPWSRSHLLHLQATRCVWGSVSSGLWG